MDWMDKLHKTDFAFIEDEHLSEKGDQQFSGKWNILIVDDEEDLHSVTRLALKQLTYKDKYIDFLSAYSASDAKEILKTNADIAVLFLDVVMEHENAGLELVHYIRKVLKNNMIQIVLRTGYPGQAPEERVSIEYEINDYREKHELTSRKLRSITINAIRSYSNLVKNNAYSKELESTQNELFFTLGEIAESRSHETGNHVKRVGEIAELLALKYRMSPKEAELLKLAATMHDIGKLAIYDTILNKPGSLTSDEFTIMKTHTVIGYQMLNSSKKEILKSSAEIAYQHHENFDGSGYPCGLKGEDINIASRIVAIADVFDALGNRRVYKEPWSIDTIIEYLEKEKGKKFDPMLIDLFFENLEEFKTIRERFPD